MARVPGVTWVFSPVKEAGQRWETPGLQGHFSSDTALGRWGWAAPAGGGMGLYIPSRVSSQASRYQCPGTDRPKGNVWPPVCMRHWRPNLPLPPPSSRALSPMSLPPSSPGWLS